VFNYENFFFSLSGVQLTAPVQMIASKESQVKFVYEGHLMKVKVTSKNSWKSLFPQCKLRP